MSYFRTNYDSPASYDFVENNKLLYLFDNFLNKKIFMPLMDSISILN